MNAHASHTPVIRPLAAAHLRDALNAATARDLPTALGALMAIDNESWQGITNRLAELGPAVTALVTETLGGAA
ncbi:hypothetical protein ABH940_002852 [Streptacidiphilus sp. BW17]|uniref:hypothetical protein n=1 Tax=Streptacidiphilus sp. BW17 TaxID=3156274 RepID=UPI00351864E2